MQPHCSGYSVRHLQLHVPTLSLKGHKSIDLYIFKSSHFSITHIYLYLVHRQTLQSQNSLGSKDQYNSNCVLHSWFGTSRLTLLRQIWNMHAHKRGENFLFLSEFYLRSGSWTCLCSGRGDGRGLELALVFNVFSTVDTMSRHPCTKTTSTLK